MATDDAGDGTPAEDAVDAVEEADVALTRRAARHRDAAPVKAAGLLSNLADQPPLVALSSAGIAAGLLLDRPRLTRTGVRVLAGTLVATAAKTAIKRMVDRSRPHLLVDEGLYRLDRGTTTADGEMNSFPSGHTADAVAAAQAIAREWPAATMPAYMAAAIVGAVQIPRCRHYLSDVAAGAVVGHAAAWLADRLATPLLDRIAPLPARLARLPAPRRESGRGAGGPGDAPPPGR